MKARLKTVLFAAGGAITALILNFVFIERLLIPDPCYYHTNDTNSVFDLFYTISAAEGYHPSPTLFNFLLTVGIGIVLGLLLDRAVEKRLRYSGLIDVSRRYD